MATTIKRAGTVTAKTGKSIVKRGRGRPPGKANAKKTTTAVNIFGDSEILTLLLARRLIEEKLDLLVS